MSDNKFPHPALLRRSTKVDAIENYLNKYEGMVSCTVNVDPSEKLPVLPFKLDNRLIFPCGTFTGSWTFSEMRYALKNSKTKIIAVTEIVYAPAIDSPFGGFAKDIWHRRSTTTNAFENYYYKLLGNNLWGKLAQRAREEFRYCTSTKEAKEFMKKKKLRKVEILDVNTGFFIKYENYRLFNHTIACWAAYITAYVRIMLHAEMKRDGDKLVYCDTDSRFVEKTYNYKTGKLLGGWKKEEKTVTKIRALKDYVYVYHKDNKLITAQMLKGVRKDWEQLDSEANVFKGKRMIRTRESFRRVDNLPPGTFIEQVKTLSGDYLKRKVFPDGSTKPFIL